MIYNRKKEVSVSLIAVLIFGFMFLWNGCNDIQIVETDEFTVEILDDWVSEIDDSIEPIASIVSMNKSQVGEIVTDGMFIMCFNQVFDPEFLINQQVKEGVNEFFKNSSTGSITDCKIAKIDGKQISFSKSISGALYNGKVFVVNNGGKTFLIFDFCKEGCVSESSKILNTLKFKDNRLNTPKKDVITEIRDYIETLKRYLPKQVDEYTTMIDCELSSTNEELIYTYAITVSISDFESEEAVANIINGVKPVVLESLITESKSLPMIKSCMDRKMSFTYTYLDSDKKFLGSITFTPDDYEQ